VMMMQIIGSAVCCMEPINACYYIQCANPQNLLCLVYGLGLQMFNALLSLNNQHFHCTYMVPCRVQCWGQQTEIKFFTTFCVPH